MTRAMGDATHDQVAAIPPWVDLVAGYVTGTADIQWTPADWERFPVGSRVTIDQGGPGAPVYAADVIDVEAGAYVPGDVPGWIGRCTAPRPTAYVNRSNLAPVLSTGFQGDLWLAYPGWSAGQPLPDAPGCTIVAVQHSFFAAYDLSAVLDPTWPSPAAEGNQMNDLYRDTATGAVYLLNGGRMHHVGSSAAFDALRAAGHTSVDLPSDEIAAMLVDFPTSELAGTLTVTGTLNVAG